MGRAVISLLEHLGDIVAAEPAARHLKKEGFRVTWCVLDRYRDLPARNPSVDEVRVLGSLSEWEAIPYEREYDLVADMHFDGRVCAATGRAVRKRTGDKSVSLDNYYDHPSLLAAFCASAGLPRLDGAPEIHLPPGPPPLEGPYAVFHCSANEPDRRWRPELWRMLARDASARLPVVEVGAPAVLGGVRGVLDRSGTLPLASLADAIRGCSLFVGGDSGPAHMAGALRRPSVLVMGRCRRWSLYNPHTGFLRENRDRFVLQPGCATADVPYVLARAMLMDRLDEILP